MAMSTNPTIQPRTRPLGANQIFDPPLAEARNTLSAVWLI